MIARTTTYCHVLQPLPLTSRMLYLFGPSLDLRYSCIRVAGTSSPGTKHNGHPRKGFACTPDGSHSVHEQCVTWNGTRQSGRKDFTRACFARGILSCRLYSLTLTHIHNSCLSSGAAICVALSAKTPNEEGGFGF